VIAAFVGALGRHSLQALTRASARPIVCSCYAFSTSVQYFETKEFKAVSKDVRVGVEAVEYEESMSLRIDVKSSMLVVSLERY